MYICETTGVIVIVSVSFRRVAFELVLDLLFEESEKMLRSSCMRPKVSF